MKDAAFPDAEAVKEVFTLARPEASASELFIRAADPELKAIFDSTNAELVSTKESIPELIATLELFNEFKEADIDELPEAAAVTATDNEARPEERATLELA